VVAGRKAAGKRRKPKASSQTGLERQRRRRRPAH